MFFYKEIEEIIQSIFTNWTEAQKITASDKQATDYFGTSIAISSDGNTLVVSAANEDPGGISNAGSLYVFSKQENGWVQTHKLFVNDPVSGDSLGYSIDINSNGTVIVAGCHWKDPSGLSQAGAAYIFEKSGSTWSQTAKLIASDPASADNFGLSVAIDGEGTTVAICSPGDDSTYSNTGSVYIFAKSGSTWLQTQKLLPNDITRTKIGESVKISADGTTMIVGGRNDGNAYIFNKSGSTWTETQILQPNDPQSNSYFGNAVAISSNGSVVVVGAEQFDGTNKQDMGAAYIFEKSGLTWTQTKKITASDSASGDNFGNSVAMSGDGDTVVVGAKFDTHSNQTNAGGAYIYRKEESVWSQTKKLTASDAFSTDYFGFCVAVDSNASTILASAAYEDPEDLQNAGSVYVFNGQ